MTEQRRCYNAAEIADMLGLSLDAFYEQRQALHDKKGMPASATPGRIRIPMQAFDAWLNGDRRKEPWRLGANDNPPGRVPQDDDDHRAHLQRVYAPR